VLASSPILARAHVVIIAVDIIIIIIDD